MSKKEQNVLLHTYKGIDYRLRFDFNGVCDMEEAEGMDIPSLLITGLPGFRKLTYYGLLGHKGMTKQKAGLIVQDMIENETEEEPGLELLSKKLKEILVQGKFITLEEEAESDDDEEEVEEKKS